VYVLQDVLNGEEGLSEEEKTRRKAERRKAKRKVRGDKLCHTKYKNESPLTYFTVRAALLCIVFFTFCSYCERSHK